MRWEGAQLWARRFESAVRVAMAIGVVAAMSGCAAFEVWDSEFVVFNGTPSTNPTVVQLVATVSVPEDPTARRVLATCTGVFFAIAPGATTSQDIGTARHCVRMEEAAAGLPAGHEFAADHLFAFTGDDFSQGFTDGQQLNVGSVRFHPAADIAVLRLEQPVNVAPALLFRGPVTTGQAVRVEGFGVEQEQEQDAATGRKLAAPSEVLAIDSAEMVRYLEGKGATVGPGPDGRAPAQALQEKYGTNLYIGNSDPANPGGTHCMGDSGGPTFVTVNGVDYVAGINSHGFGPACQDPLAIGGSVRVDAYLDWFAAPPPTGGPTGPTLPPGGVRPQPPAPPQAGSGSGPTGCAATTGSPLALWGLIGLAVLRRRRRRRRRVN